MQDKKYWLEIHDSEITSAELVADIERRVQKRREELGEVRLILPRFGEVSSFPEPPKNRPYNPNLYHHLRRANASEPPPLTPELAPSPATRVPVLGRLWQLFRKQFHELILFYVNRLGGYEAKLDSHLISILNELTRVVEAQQDEIDRLREKLEGQDKAE